jgi:hypothetical protein
MSQQAATDGCHHALAPESPAGVNLKTCTQPDACTATEMISIIPRPNSGVSPNAIHVASLAVTSAADLASSQSEAAQPAAFTAAALSLRSFFPTPLRI